MVGPNPTPANDYVLAIPWHLLRSSSRKVTSITGAVRHRPFAHPNARADGAAQVTKMTVPSCKVLDQRNVYRWAARGFCEYSNGETTCGWNSRGRVLHIRNRTIGNR